MIAFESAPVTSFHRRLAISGGGGQFSDAFSLGIIGIALAMAKEPLGLTSWWLGALGAASLVGLFFGSLLAGAVADRFGRRPIFVWDMLFFTACAVLQYRSSSLFELFAIRVLLGVALGADYVACKALVTEYSPTRSRGQILSVLAAAWTAGYLCSYLVGFVVRASGPDAWRVALLASAVPSFVTFLFRLRTPESPLWLMRMGQPEKAAQIIATHLGPGIALPVMQDPGVTRAMPPAGLLKQPLLRNLFVGCVFHTSQVIPTFALGTFLPIVMAQLGLGDGYTGALIYNIVFMLGALVGMFIIDRIPRRTVLVHGFTTMAFLLALMIGWRTAPAVVIIPLFATFAFVLSVAGILQYVYPPELFPTELRARGIGAIIATSRIGTASSTFLLPAVVEQYGVRTALGACMAVMIFAAIVCHRWAPETLRRQLA